MGFIIGFWTILWSVWGAGPTIYTYRLPTDGPLLSALRKEYMQVIPLRDNDLESHTFPRGSVLLLDGSQPLPPACRQSLYELRRNGGQLFIFGNKAFNYQPVPTNPARIANLADSSQYRVTRPVRKVRAASYEQPVIQTVTSDIGTTGLAFKTTRRGMPDILLHVRPEAEAIAGRTVLSLRAKGNVYMDLLAVEITDRSDKKWLGFIPLTRQWQRYHLSLADLIPEGWRHESGSYSLLDPAEITDIAVGTNLLTIWREQPMEFAISDIALAEDAGGHYTPTGHNRSLRLPFLENDTHVPPWLLDERGSEYREFPGSITGTDHRKGYDHAAERMVRSWQPASGASVQYVGDGRFRGSVFGVFLQTATVIQADAERTDSVVRTILDLTSRPRITAVVPDVITTAEQQHRFALHITVHNPTAQAVTGRLETDIGTALHGSQDQVSVAPHTSRTVTVALPEIPDGFPFAAFRWDVRFRSGGQTDTFSDSVDVERAILHSFIHLRKVQQQYADGRFSHHYFGDAYGVRAQLAYLSYLNANPAGRQKNHDLWQQISENDIHHSATWFLDMLVEKQDPEGGFPMGYGEHTGSRNVADGGQIALSVAQSLPYVADSTKAAAYRALCQRFFDWAETYYIDEEKSAILTASYPEAAAKGHAKAGLYGLGRSRRTITSTGPPWVLSDVLAFQLLWDRLTNRPGIGQVAQRNKAYYVGTGHSAKGYYQAEALCWAWLDSPGDPLRPKIATHLRDTFIPDLLNGGPGDMYLIGGRNTLKALPLLYYRQYIDDSPALRAAQLKYIWSYATENAPGAIRQLAAQFPKPVHGESLTATKYATLSTLWAIELLSPGSTLHPAIVTTGGQHTGLLAHHDPFIH